MFFFLDASVSDLCFTANTWGRCTLNSWCMVKKCCDLISMRLQQVEFVAVSQIRGGKFACKQTFSCLDRLQRAKFMADDAESERSSPPWTTTKFFGELFYCAYTHYNCRNIYQFSCERICYFLCVCYRLIIYIEIIDVAHACNLCIKYLWVLLW
jgi:hypothetical protein